MNRWIPLGAWTHIGFPEVGALVAWDHAVYRVLEINDIPRVDWTAADAKAAAIQGPPRIVVVRPAHITGDDTKLHRHDVHLQAQAGTTWDVYPTEHYPLCARCGEPPPCREEIAISDAAKAAKQMARYEVAGICPACQQPVRQGSRTFDENLYMPGGPPVTFHASRRECYGGLIGYEDAWVAADPDHRKPRYRCDGVLTAHSGDTYECTQGTDCPGAQASHKALQVCQCHRHTARSYRLDRDARNLAFDPQCPQHPAGNTAGGEVA